MARSDTLRAIDAYRNGDSSLLLTLGLTDDDIGGFEDDDEYDDDDEAGEGADDGGMDEGRRPDPLSARVEAVASAILPPGVIDRAARARTPGGIVGVVFALIILTIILVPATQSGATRLELVWRSLTGGAELPPTQHAPPAQESAVQVIEQDIADEWASFWNG